MFMYYDTMIGCYESHNDYSPARRRCGARLLGMYSAPSQGSVGTAE